MQRGSWFYRNPSKKQRQQTHPSRKMKRQLDQMEQLYRSREARRCYKKFNAFREGFVQRVEMYHDEDGDLMTNERAVSDWHRLQYDEHLNGIEANPPDCRRYDEVGTVNEGDEGCVIEPERTSTKLWSIQLCAKKVL